ncbi:hypothetical protein HMPREF1557_01508 [Streptococcus sobrinus W1703]|uniref:Uncharacterized protein n=1 Tax=Streptococcus sobrinus W1703 TaxID=1227275 RepID=U2J3R0_9STRE|nr:hypothetical protein HMPREF1557_01508 [Streptococcus sobrinus W1703]
MADCQTAKKRIEFLGSFLNLVKFQILYWPCLPENFDFRRG